MIEVRGLYTHYGRAEILSDVSLSIERGEVAALLGRNGAGKSTTLKSIMGLVRASQGEVLFAGDSIRRKRPFEICRAGLGYVPEDRRVFTSLTVEENLKVAQQPPRADAPAWTLERLFELFPNLAERRGHSARAMSGGEQQMLTVARTLMGNPRAILLDEPSEGLAPVIVEQMVVALHELKSAGVTILLSEQNLHFAGLIATQANIIEKGRVRFSGTMETVARDEALRAAYLTV